MGVGAAVIGAQENCSCAVPQGFLPTLLEDVPDMAVKFAVYESLRPLHQRLCGGRQARMLILVAA